MVAIVEQPDVLRFDLRMEQIASTSTARSAMGFVGPVRYFGVEAFVLGEVAASLRLDPSQQMLAK